MNANRGPSTSRSSCLGTSFVSTIAGGRGEKRPVRNVRFTRSSKRSAQSLFPILPAASDLLRSAAVANAAVRLSVPQNTSPLITTKSNAQFDDGVAELSPSGCFQGGEKKKIFIAQQFCSSMWPDTVSTIAMSKGRERTGRQWYAEITVNKHTHKEKKKKQSRGETRQSQIRRTRKERERESKRPCKFPPRARPRQGGLH